MDRIVSTDELLADDTVQHVVALPVDDAGEPVPEPEPEEPHEHFDGDDLHTHDPEAYLISYEELGKAVAHLTKANDVRLELMNELFGVEPDRFELYDIKLNLLAEIVFANVDPLARLKFEFAYQKRLENHMARVEAAARDELSKLRAVREREEKRAARKARGRAKPGTVNPN